MNTKALFLQYLRIKESRSLRFYDTHQHPFEVLGVKGYSKGVCHVTHRGPSLLELFSYKLPVLLVLRFLFRFSPEYISKSILGKFRDYTELALSDEMKAAGIDTSVFVPIEPYVSTHDLFEHTKKLQSIVLGSVDLKKINVQDIENEIKKQTEEFGIRGIKLHPNIQGFYAEPTMNSSELGGKLDRIYRIAEKYKLYILFHAGVSYIPTKGGYRRVQYGLVENFFTKDMSESVFDKIHVPVILAHMGNYNIIKPKIDLLSKIIKKYPNVYFDTAGVNPRLIEKFISKYGFSRIIFGSDSLYFDLRYAVISILKVLHKVMPEISYEEKVAAVFSRNFENVLKFDKQS